MLGSSTFDLVLGLTFVFLMLSLVVSTVREALESRLKTRARHLAKGIAQLLGGPNRAQRFYDFPLIKALHDGEVLPAGFEKFAGLNMLQAIPIFLFRWIAPPVTLPSYVPKRTFALAMLQLVRDGAFTEAIPPSAPQTPPTQAEVAARAMLTANTAAGVVAANAAAVNAVTAAAVTVTNAGGTLLPTALPPSPLTDSAMVEIKAALAAAIQADPNNDVAQSISAVLALAGDDAEKAVDALEKWYDGTMDRVSGWYKRESQHIMFWLGLVVAVGLNVDAIYLTKYLYANPEKATALVAQAELAGKGVKNIDEFCKPTVAAPAGGPLGLEPAIHCLTDLKLPIGWQTTRAKEVFNLGVDHPVNWRSAPVWETILGWFVTAFMLAFGSPFWFDLFNKMMVVRSTVKPTEKSPDEASEDGQKKVS